MHYAWEESNVFLSKIEVKVENKQNISTFCKAECELLEVAPTRIVMESNAMYFVWKKTKQAFYVVMKWTEDVHDGYV